MGALTVEQQSILYAQTIIADHKRLVEAARIRKEKAAEHKQTDKA